MGLDNKKLFIPSKKRVYLALSIVVILFILFKLTMNTTKEAEISYNLKCGGFEKLACPTGYACRYKAELPKIDEIGNCKKK